MNRVLLMALVLWVGCSRGQAPPATPAEHSHDHAPPLAPPEVSLGQVTLGGFQLAVFQQGRLYPGTKATLVLDIRQPKPEVGDAAFYVWAESLEGQRLTAPARATHEQGRYHAQLLVPSGRPEPSRAVVRVRHGTLDARERVSLSPDAPLIPTHEGPNHGLMVPLQGEVWLELKLHDDKGDLEAWFTRDRWGRAPADLPLDSEIPVSFPALKRTVTLRVRDRDKNPDEAGRTTVRDGRTNYFIYPSRDGEDAAWLTGVTFRAEVVVKASALGETPLFQLRPHTH